MNRFCKIKTIALGALAAFSLSAAAEEAPEIQRIEPLYGGALSKMSANGKWAVGDAVNNINSSYTGYPRLVNVDTGSSVELFTQEQALVGTPMGATCVSDDGKVVGGSYSGYPAVWKEGKGWTSLPTPRGYDGGTVSAITSDGRYAVGRASIQLFQELPCMWDVEKMERVDLPGMVNFNPRYKEIIEQGGDPNEWLDSDLNVRLTGVSPDANIIIGTVDFAFPDASWEFMYRRDEGKWYPLGLKYENGRLTALDTEIYGVGDCVLSSDGRSIGGVCMTASETSVPFTCSVDEPTKFTLHPEADGYGVWAIGCDGVIYGSTPISTPIRNWSAKVGKYWYDWKMVAKQLYGIDWMKDITNNDDLGLSGTVVSVSSDNLRILSSDFAQNISYIITLPRPMAEICGDVDLLGDYRVSPVDGAQFSMLQKVVIDFGRDVEVHAEKTAAQLCDADGNPVRSSINLALQADNSRRVEVLFRNFALEPGKDYYVVLPAGSVNVAGDPERLNKEIRIRYRGREAGPVRPVSVSPDMNADVPRINFTTNPVIVTFNAALAPGENPDIRLYQVKDGVEEFLYVLSASVSDRQVMIYPVSEQRLAQGTDYRIDFGAGTVTDLSGDGANEAFSITYHGSYVPEIDPSSNTIFSEDFTFGVAGMMLFEGDGNTPDAEMQSWGFEAEDRPWVPIYDEVNPNMAAASHSSYDPAGKSDDWMVTPQLFIPDDKALLTFKSQSYRAAKQDVLKVYVWASDDVVTILTPNVIDKMRYDGDLVYSEAQTPGASEENLDGDWKVNSVDLSKYAGKFIYIAFVNDNQNQSAIFVDDVVVSRDVVAVMSVDTQKTMVDQDEAQIRGRFIVMKEDGIKGYELTLSDGEGNKLGSVVSDESLEKGEFCSFSFDKAVALEKGVVNPFVITFTSGTESITLNHDISNLLFNTTKRIVLEEMTGTGCQFCPLGIVGIEFLQEMFGDTFIPMAIHSYPGDQFGGAEVNAYSSFLGQTGAPTGNINRGPVCSPAYNLGSDYTFTAPDGNTWLHKAEEALQEMTHIDMDVKSAYIDEIDRKVQVDATVKSAINLSGASINVFGVLMEDGLIAQQTNGLSNSEAELLGEWGNGGKYATDRVLWIYDDVVRGTSTIETAGIYSGFNGRGGYIPSEIKAGEDISFTFDFNLPSGIKDLTKTKVCLMLIDANTGEYINAARSGYATTAAVGGIAAEEVEFADVYDLAGRVVMRGASLDDLNGLEKGIYIRAGKKFIVH